MTIESENASRRFVLTAGVCLSVVFLAACVTPSPTTLREVVAQEAILFDNEREIPRELVDTLASRRVILLGETHYVQEHQEFLVRLLKELHPRGLRYFVQEMSHAAGWAVDDYVTGRREDYPPHVAPIDRYWIEKLRAFNNNLPPEERIRVRYNDMNHDPSLFRYTVQMIAHESETVAIVACSLLVTQPGTPEYLAAARDLKHLLQEQRHILHPKIGDPWFRRLEETLAVELRSAVLRRRWSNADREELMIDLTVRTMEEARETGALTVINVGMYHAQRKRFMGTRQEWLGEYLVRHPELYGGADYLYSLAFFGLAGEKRMAFMDPRTYPVPPARERPARNLARAIADVAYGGVSKTSVATRARAVYLDLGNPVFQRSMPVAFSHSPQRAIPGKQFDGYIVYPVISVLESIHLTHP